MDAQLQELLPFLHDRNPEVRRVALENLLGHTPAGSPNRDIFFAGMQVGGGFEFDATNKDTELARDLKLLCRDQLAIAHDAFRALINLSDTPFWVTSLSEPTFLVFLVSYILHPPSVLADLAAMLLSNLTTSHAVCASILSMKIPIIRESSLRYRYFPTQARSGTSPTPPLSSNCETVELSALPLLVDAFVNGANVGHDSLSVGLARKGQLHFLASVFANLSTTPPGRLFFVTPRPGDPFSLTVDVEYPLAKLVSFTEYPDTIRRRGVTSAIKNCSFHVPAHQALLSPEDTRVLVPPSTVSAPGVNILPAILLPLAGPEELDLEDQEKLPEALQFLPATKKREPDGILRQTHIETLLLLCTTRWGREFLRDHGTYEIVRTMHEAEHVDKVSEHIERVVNLLKRDEGDEDGDSSAQNADSEDERIEEV